MDYENYTQREAYCESFYSKTYYVDSYAFLPTKMLLVFINKTNGNCVLSEYEIQKNSVFELPIFQILFV